ncbi:MAG TPA: AAA family ATPase [Mycobacterium sp.]|nr:AAA family ATPase [Mycobacterium sp.]
MKLIGRCTECGVLDRLVEAVRAGESRTIVVCGDAGLGKSALLDYVADQASDCRVVRAAGVQSEMELPFAALHQVCTPGLNSLQHLPVPQRDALRIAFGLTAGPAPDRFLVGLAVLSLLADVAEQQPLVCLVDDEQWLDRSSAQVLGFVARRLVAESVGLVFGTRTPGSDLAGLPELEIKGLRAADARALLDAALVGLLDTRVRDQVVAETQGNPLALLELPRGLTPQELAGGFGILDAVRFSGGVEGGIEESFRRRIDVLPEETCRLLLVAAAEPVGDPALVWGAAARLGIGADAAEPAVEAGLVEFAGWVRFRHPVVRSVVYASASTSTRREVHGALAQVTDAEQDPDRRAWHRAHAVAGPDQDVAAELERSAARAKGRGGLAAAAAFLGRATILTLDPAQRADRALAAAVAHVQTGAFDAAREMISIAEAQSLNDFQQARIDEIRAELAFVESRGGDAPALLLKAARRLEPIDIDLSRATYLRALEAAMFAGPLARGGEMQEVARAAAAVPSPQHVRAPDLFLDGLAMLYNTGYGAAVPILRRALDAFDTDLSPEEELRWHYLAFLVAVLIWEDHRLKPLSDRYVELVRGLGALTELPLALTSKVTMLTFVGELTVASAIIGELQAAMEATGISFAPYGALAVAARRGRYAEAVALIEATTREVSQRGEGRAIAFADWASALLNNGLGRYQEAMTAAQRVIHRAELTSIPRWGLVELIEAATRSGRSDIAADALGRLAVATSASGTDWALGIEARSRALLTEGEAAERLHREAIERLERTSTRTELARARLLYGEWLRREHRRGDARTQLRIAYNMFEAMGMEAFAERAGRELKATGETARKPSVPTSDDQLTAQEAQIARMARDGLSNPEIGARLFLSARTVQYHLKKVFIKLGIESRTQLDRVLAD